MKLETRQAPRQDSPRHTCCETKRPVLPPGLRSLCCCPQTGRGKKGQGGLCARVCTCLCAFPPGHARQGSEGAAKRRGIARLRQSLARRPPRPASGRGRPQPALTWAGGAGRRRWEPLGRAARRGIAGAAVRCGAGAGSCRRRALDAPGTARGAPRGRAAKFVYLQDPPPALTQSAGETRPRRPRHLLGARLRAAQAGAGRWRGQPRPAPHAALRSPRETRRGEARLGGGCRSLAKARLTHRTAPSRGKPRAGFSVEPPPPGARSPPPRLLGPHLPALRSPLAAFLPAKFPGGGGRGAPGPEPQPKPSSPTNTQGCPGAHLKRGLSMASCSAGH